METKPRLSVKLATFALIAFTCIALLEIGARIIVPDQAGDPVSPFLEGISQRIYSKEELDGRLPFQLPRQGGDCLTYRLGKLYWNEWWGYSAKILNKECGKELFSKYPIRVILFGGSAMYNAEAPNYLTHIDYLSFKSDERIASINLAESGARLSNMLARFIHEAVELKPNVAVFLDGFNEFNSVRYGGEAGYDFYWTAGVKDRIENPVSFFVDKFIEKSRFAQLALIHTRLIRSARIANLTSPPLPDADAQIYLRDRGVLSVLCRYYNIECIFIIQPVTFVADPASSKTAKIVALHAMQFPHDPQLYRNGFELLRKEKCHMCLDASHLLDDIDDAYFDVVHFTKYGGAKLGEIIHNAVVAAYDRSIKFGQRERLDTTPR